MAEENNELKGFHEALVKLPFWAKILLCFVNIIYGIDRLIEAIDSKNTLSLLLSIVWLFLYPVNIIVDIIWLCMKGTWFSTVGIVAENASGSTSTADAVEVETKEPEDKKAE